MGTQTYTIATAKVPRMILENITRDRAKLLSYYDAYTLHPEKVMAPYLDAKPNKRFPIFLDRVFRGTDAKVGRKSSPCHVVT